MNTALIIYPNPGQDWNKVKVGGGGFQTNPEIFFWQIYFASWNACSNSKTNFRCSTGLSRGGDVEDNTCKCGRGKTRNYLVGMGWSRMCWCEPMTSGTCVSMYIHIYVQGCMCFCAFGLGCLGMLN